MINLSITLPVFNEEQILETEVEKIIFGMGKKMPTVSYELLMIENGSTDGTKEIINKLIKKFPAIIRAEYLPVADYGLAVKECLLQSIGECIIVFNIDFWEIDFIIKSLDILKKEWVSVVIGSKSMLGAKDKRTFLRRSVTWGFNLLLKILFGFRGTDTHGIKMFNRENILSIVRDCRTDRIIFDTELILRAQRVGLKIKEIPVSCVEKRETRLNILKSVKQTVEDLFILFFSMRK